MISTNGVPGRPAYFWQVVGEERGVLEVAIRCQTTGDEILSVMAASVEDAMAQARVAIDRVTYEAVNQRAF
jgi:hypothetical protein